MHGAADLSGEALILRGDAAAFEELMRVLRGGRSTTLELEPALPHPATRSIGALHIAITEQVATVRLSNDSAILAGSGRSLARLADEIRLFIHYNDLSEPGMHAHITAGGGLSGDQVLADGSCDLVLAGSVPDG